MDGLMKLYRKERVNDYFKKYAHTQIDVAHRIMEYLEPDEYSKPKDLNEDIMDMFKANKPMEAVHHIFLELDVDIDCSSGYDSLEAEANEFAKEVLKDYFKKRENSLLSEREKLVKRLAEIDGMLLKE